MSLEVVETPLSGKPQTVLSLPAKTYSLGMADTEALLNDGNDYLVRVLLETGGDSKSDVLDFPIRVAAWYRAMLLPALLVLGVAGADRDIGRSLLCDRPTRPVSGGMMSIERVQQIPLRGRHPWLNHKQHGRRLGKLARALRRAHVPSIRLIGWSDGSRCFGARRLVIAANVFLWFWNYNFMFSAGLNSASVEFTRYYRSLFWGQVITLGVFGGAWFGWLIRTGRAMVGKPCERAEEVRRIAILWSIIGVTSLSIYIEASFWPNWDGSWHQTMVRDTALTPTHIPMFYFFFPLSSMLAVGAYLYGRFRIPALYGSGQGLSLVLLPVDQRRGARMHGGRCQRVGT